MLCATSISAWSAELWLNSVPTTFAQTLNLSLNPAPVS